MRPRLVAWLRSLVPKSRQCARASWWSEGLRLHFPELMHIEGSIRGFGGL